MTKQKRLKSILVLTLSILMLAIMAVFPIINNNVSAEETTSASENLFDMQLFSPENAGTISSSFETLILAKNGILVRYTDNGEGNTNFFYSGGTFISAGTYTISFIYNGYELLNYVNVKVYGAGGIVDTIYIGSNGFYEKTFTIDEAAMYTFAIVVSGSTLEAGTIYNFSFSEIMLNEGSEPLPFQPYIEINDEIEAINQGSNNIIAKLDELFGAESGIIAGASLGTVILLIAILLFITKKR